MREWLDNWNPFNSAKLFTHLDRWREFESGRYPIPVLLTIDPTNRCNFDCVWCNARAVRSRNHSLSKSVIDEIVAIAPIGEEFRLKTACVAGGGEPFCNPSTAYLLERLHGRSIRIGVVTNGSILPHDLEPVLRCEWIGVSIDAATAKTFSLLKQVQEDWFTRVIENVNELVKRSRDVPGYLPSGVTYKFLVHPDNIEEMYDATLLAKDLGCRQIHFRPAGVPWYALRVDANNNVFSERHVKKYNDAIYGCLLEADESFGVFGQTHKFNEDFSIKHDFEKCYATYMTAVIQPSENADEFAVGLCCDRRGDESLELGSFKTAEEFHRAWGGERHRAITDAIDLGRCPRCTLAPHNEIYENVILKKKMCEDFI